MTIQEKLLELGFTEGVDYSITNNQLTALPKIRQVEQIIHHPEIIEVIGQLAHGIIPAEFDAQGHEITPMQPAQDFIAAVAPVPAWDETILVNETYFAQLPDLDSVKLECQDISLLIGEYLADKSNLKDLENDCLNIVNGQIFSWDFSNIPQPSVAELLALIPVLEAKQSIEAKLKQIAELELQITPRRLREAVLSGDNTFISGIDAQILAIRATL